LPLVLLDHWRHCVITRTNEQGPFWDYEDYLIAKIGP